MESANYSVVRYMPDPGRGERLNIGILLWTEERYDLRLDHDAIDRVLRDNPRLVRESLLYVAPMIEERLRGDHVQLTQRVADLLATHKFPIDLTEPRFTSLPSHTEIDDALEALVDRVVRPRRRYAPPGFNPRTQIERRLRKHLKQGNVVRDHFFNTSRTGVDRAVDFFANGSRSTALDVVRLAIKRAEEIRSRADAEAFKVYDIRSRNEVRFVVYCDFSPEIALETANGAARKVIESTGAVVVTDADAAAGVMLRAAD